MQLKVRLRSLLILAGIVVSLCTLTGFLGRLWWVFDLTSHFRVQYALVLIVLATGVAACREYRWALVFLLCVAINAALLLPCYHGRRAPLADSRSFKLLLINVRTENTRYDLVKRCITQHQPDLVLLEEMDHRWAVALAEMQRDFTQTLTEPREDNFGLALFSRMPLKNPQVVYLGEAGVPSIVAELALDEQKVFFCGTHPLPPAGRHRSVQRNQQLEAISEFLRVRAQPKILLGDLNVTPWSYHFRRLIRNGGMRDTMQGFGVQPSWPSHLWPMRIPIDHCLVSSEFVTIDRKVLEDVGSDHLPVLIELQLTPVNKRK